MSKLIIRGGILMKKILSLFLAVIVCVVNMNFVWASSSDIYYYKEISNEYKGHRYELFDKDLDWDGAKKYCESLGGHLATISSKEENDFIYELMIDSGYTSAYFGLTDEDEEGTWVWVNGEPVEYTNWHKGEPNSENSNEDYAMFYWKYTDGTWNDGDFGGKTNSGGTTFICEWDSVDTEDFNQRIDVPTGIVESDNLNEYEGHRYEVFDNGLDWDGAKKYCESLGGHLATISSKEENDFIYELMIDSGYTSAYFGLTDEDEEGTWVWVNGEPVEYTNWHSGEPNSENTNEDYAMFYWKYTDGTWNDGDFGGKTNSGGTAFICEWDSIDTGAESISVDEDEGEFHFYLNTATNCVAKGSTIKMYAGFFVNGELSPLSNENSYSISVSDSSIINVVSSGWDAVYGQCYTINSLNPGSVTLTMTNLSNGAMGTLDIYVVDSEMVYNFKNVPEMIIEEGKITNFYNYCGMVVDDFDYKEHKNNEDAIDYYDVTMTIYNSLDLYGAVTAYDAEGNIYDYNVIEKFTTMESSFKDSVTNLVKEIGDLFYLLDNNKYYSGESISKKTDVHIKVPADGYIEISNSPKSVVALIVNSTAITVDFIKKTGDLVNNASEIIDSGAIAEKVLYDAFTEGYLNDVMIDMIKETAEKELMNGEWSLSNFGDVLQSFFDVLTQSGFNLIEIITEEIVSGTALLSMTESFVLNCIPTGNIINALYSFSDIGELIIEINLFNKSVDVPAGIYIHTNGFTDVTVDTYYYEAVEWAVNNGIVSGTGNDTFEPNAICTRAQALTFLWRAVGSPKPSDTNTDFIDLNKDAYYYNAVLWAVEQGIASGISSTEFGPDELCNRAQIVTFLYRQAGSPDVSGSGFDDVRKDLYYTLAVQWAVALGITSGTSNTAFSPESPCTRAQVVTFLYRYIA